MLVASPALPNSGRSLPQASSGAASAAAGREDFDIQRDLLGPVANVDFDALGRVLAPDCLLLLPGIRPVAGAVLVTRVLRSLRRRFESLDFETVLHFRSSDDMFVAKSVVQGTCNGAPYSNDAITLVRLDRAGLVALITDYFKDTAAPVQTVRRPLPSHA